MFNTLSLTKWWEGRETGERDKYRHIDREREEREREICAHNMHYFPFAPLYTFVCMYDV